MPGTPIPRNSDKPLPLPRRWALLVGLVALALFVVGPQAGSFDDDGDGSPDIPVVVSGVTLVGDVSRTTSVSQRKQIVHEAVPAPTIAMLTRQSGIGKSDFTAPDGRSVLRSCCMLRC